jgi:hypothetical protein
MANQLSGRELYRWHTLTVDGGQVWASDGLQITPDAAMHKAPPMDTVIVCGGVGIQRTVTREHVSWLQARRVSRAAWARCAPAAGRWPAPACSTASIAACTGNAWPRCRSLPAGEHEHPPVHPRPQPLHQLRWHRAAGHDAAPDQPRSRPRTVGGDLEMFVYERIRNEQDHQRVPLKHMLGTNQPKLQEIVALMEANLEEPIDLDELAVYVAVSRASWSGCSRSTCTARRRATTSSCA